jgi:hypothetical protein
MKERLKKDFLSSRKAQFFSIFYHVQFPIILDDIQSVLELDGGNNTSKALIKHYNINHLDVDLI